MSVFFYFITDDIVVSFSGNGEKKNLREGNINKRTCFTIQLETLDTMNVSQLQLTPKIKGSARHIFIYKL